MSWEALPTYLSIPFEGWWALVNLRNGTGQAILAVVQQAGNDACITTASPELPQLGGCE